MMLIHLTKTGHKLAFNFMYMYYTHNQLRLVYSYSLSCSRCVTYSIEQFIYGFFFVCLTCEYDRIPCNDGDNLPHKHCMVDRNCNCSGAEQIPTFFDMCFKNILPHVQHFMNEKRKTKQNRVNAVVESAGIPYSNYNNYFSFEMIK